MTGVKHGSLAWMTCLVLAVWLGFSAPAGAAQGVTGEGLIVEKDIQKGLLTLKSGVVLQVTPLTKIASAKGKRIALTDLKVAPSMAGGALVGLSGDAMVQYRGRAHAGHVTAYSIQVMGTVPH